MASLAVIVACGSDGTGPSSPPAAATTELVSGDVDDHPIDIGPHGTRMGGQWLMPGMMGGMHAGMPMSGMGAGWKAANGSYGMVFIFTTA